MAAITMTETSDSPYLGKSHVFSKSYNSDKSKETFTWKCWPQEVPYSYTYYGKSYSGYYTGGTSSKPGGILRGSELTRYTRRGIFEGIRIHQIKWRKNEKITRRCYYGTYTWRNFAFCAGYGYTNKTA